ncbi:transcriptional regulator [Enterobacter hormaechei]|uniref:transcriptional regulator n=1 Tax=Enterobacter quasihormaechei TaxID=2529382 RepID=UPI000DCEA2A1|nr:transcriptional regulator [Enterobacter hormaechei]
MNKRYCSVNNWLIDVASGSILHLASGERKRLGEYQLKLLDILSQNAGKIFTREELTTLVWERRVIGNNSLPNAIHALRTALEDDGKNQRIIKTIPRRGYLLEAEYCCTVEKDEEEVSQPEELLDGQEESAAGQRALLPVAQEANEDKVPNETLLRVIEPKKGHRRLFSFMLVILFTACITLLVNGYFAGSFGERLNARELHQGIYSNIRIYSVESRVEPAYMAANLYNKLKDSLYTLNQQIKMKSATMEVFFYGNTPTLNYSFVLTNGCDQKQLAMVIYHWRVDPVRLNDLILRETRRKLNEMATCKTN